MEAVATYAARAAEKLRQEGQAAGAMQVSVSIGLLFIAVKVAIAIFTAMNSNGFTPFHWYPE